MDVYDVTIAFFFQAEDGIRNKKRSRELEDVYERQWIDRTESWKTAIPGVSPNAYGLGATVRHGFIVLTQSVVLVWSWSVVDGRRVVDLIK